MKKEKFNWMKIIKYTFGCMVFCVFLYFLLGELLLPKGQLGDFSCKEFEAQWERVYEDGTRESVEIPGNCKAIRGETVMVETILPEEMEENTYLCFRSAKQDLRIYIDGTLREEYVSDNYRLFGTSGAVVYVFLKVKSTDLGKRLAVEVCTDSSYSGIFYTVYQGEQLGIWYLFFKQYGSELITAFLTLFLGAISIGGSIILRKCYHRDIELEFLGWGVFLAAVWLITNSIFRQLFFPNFEVVSDITFFMIMLLPFPYIIYVNELQKHRYEKIHTVMGMIAIFNFVLCTCLHVTRVVDFGDTFVLIACVCIFTIVTLGYTIAMDIRKGFIKEYRLVAVGIFAACVAACVQIVMYFQRSTVFNGVAMALGLIFLLIVAIIDTMRGILVMEGEKQQAISASEAKARFLANMSHEIRTPINAVLGMDAMILRESREDTIKEYALDIQNAGQSLLALVNDILDFSKIESGKMELLPEEYDFSSLIHDIFNMISMKAEAKDLKLELHVDETLPSRLYGDDIRIRQILVNLLNNGVKYTQKGSVTLNVTGVKKGDMINLHFEVVDTGIGIRQEDIVKLFVEFERIDEQKNRNIEGTGLGMNIVVQLLKMMDSYLDVESTYGEGSTFSFDVLQKIVDEDPICNLEERIKQQTRSYSYEASFVAPKAKVLVVDDNSVNRKVFINLLKETQIQIFEASGGKECLELVRDNFYDVIFLDHMMPDMDGLEVLKCMKNWKDDYPCSNTPVVVLTANAIVGAREMYLAQGFDGFVSKPISPDKLEKLLMEMIPEEKITIGAPVKQITKMTEKEGMKSVVSIDDFPEMPGVDWNYGLLHLADVKLLWDTVRDYYYAMDMDGEHLESLYTDISDENVREQYRVLIHSMKSSAAMIGAFFVSGMAQMLELAAGDGQLELITIVTPFFLKKWRELRNQLSFVLDKEHTKADKKDTKSLDEKMLKEYLSLISEALEQMDVDTADALLERISQYAFSQEQLSFLEELTVAVKMLDRDRVETLRKAWCEE